MRAILLHLLCGLALSLVGCAKKAPPPGKAAGDHCVTDADCVLTHSAKSCCRGCAPPYAVTRARQAALDRWYKKHCPHGDDGCPKKKCAADNHRRTPRCKKRRCVTEVELRK